MYLGFLEDNKKDLGFGSKKHTQDLSPSRQDTRDDKSFVVPVDSVVLVGRTVGGKSLVS